MAEYFYFFYQSGEILPNLVKLFASPKIFRWSEPGERGQDDDNDQHPEADAQFTGQVVGEVRDEQDEDARAAVQRGNDASCGSK